MKWLGIVIISLGLVGCQTQQQAPAQPSSSTSSQTSQAESSKGAAQPASESSSKSSQSQPKQSIAAVIKQFATDAPDANLNKLELEYEDGQLQWELEGHTDADEVELKIDDASGRVIKRKQEPDTDGKKPAVPADRLKPLNDITQVAVAKLDGSRATEWSLKLRDNQVWSWKVTVKTPQQKLKVYVDATNGEVLRTKQDD